MVMWVGVVTRTGVAIGVVVTAEVIAMVIIMGTDKATNVVMQPATDMVVIITIGTITREE